MIGPMLGRIGLPVLRRFMGADRRRPLSVTGSKRWVAAGMLGELVRPSEVGMNWWRFP